MLPKNKKIGEEGQALFEMVIFLPFLIYLFSVMVNVTNSINASINQQKAVRGYMFSVIKGNSMAPTMEDLSDTYDRGSIELGSALSIGWQEKRDGDSPLGPCFKFASFLGSATDETCDDPSSAEGSKSMFIRVFTFYGLCGATYRRTGKYYQMDEREKGVGTCLLR